MEQFESHTLMVGVKKYDCFSKILRQFLIVLNMYLIIAQEVNSQVISQ